MVLSMSNSILNDAHLWVFRSNIPLLLPRSSYQQSHWCTGPPIQAATKLYLPPNCKISLKSRFLVDCIVYHLLDPDAADPSSITPTNRFASSQF